MHVWLQIPAEAVKPADLLIEGPDAESLDMERLSCGDEKVGVRAIQAQVAQRGHSGQMNVAGTGTGLPKAMCSTKFRSADLHRALSFSQGAPSKNARATWSRLLRPNRVHTSTRMRCASLSAQQSGATELLRRSLASCKYCVAMGAVKGSLSLGIRH